jgi:glycosyltransferase involved in cell wall biosynthesis
MSNMTSPTPIHPLASVRLDEPQVDIVIPVYNEQQTLEQSLERLHTHMVERMSLDFTITIADNASIDETAAIAAMLAQRYERVRWLGLQEKGRGRALRAAWSASRAQVLAYMDVDLSTDLAALEDLLSPLLEGRAQVAIGSRLAPGAQVTRGVKREFISRSYNLLLRRLLHVGFSDAQCGFKAVRRDQVGVLLAAVSDQNWFFDTELLYRAEQSGLMICEVPVRWVEDRDSRVDILATVREDLRGIWRLRSSRGVDTGVEPRAVAATQAKAHLSTAG